MKVLPPGNVLQNMYLRRLLRRRHWTSFLEVGSGNGYVSRILLEAGLSGVGCDLNTSACSNNARLNDRYIDVNKYEVRPDDFFKTNTDKKFDLVISCMVLEHLADSDVDKFIDRAKHLLNKGGSLVLLVPSSMKYWGIEDEIAGHMKRYEFKDFELLADSHRLVIREMVGLTYPMSNMLIRLSNHLVSKSESKLLSQSQRDKTIYTGNRNVPYKTTFPRWMGVFLNEVVLWPFHILQVVNAKNPKSLVIAAELSPS